MTDLIADQPTPELVHPEEIRASFEVQLGHGRFLAATARCTPAGVIAAGIMVSGILLSVASVVWAARRSR